MCTNSRYLWQFVSLNLCWYSLISLLVAGCGISHVDKTGSASPPYFPSADWKYGRYCGKGHPSEVNYYTEPKDDIDEACKEHDKCWVTYGENNGLCNDALLAKIEQLDNYFKNEVNYYSSLFRENLTFLDILTDNTSRTHRFYTKWNHAVRCQHITNDIMLAFTTIAVKSNYTNENQTSNDYARKLTFTGIGVIPLTILEALRLNAAIREYPDKDETCNLNDQ